jgi:hypothetical protein
LKDFDSIISDLEQQRSAIDRAISALREVTGTHTASSVTASAPRDGAATKKRTITPAGRKKIAEAMRRRWAAKRVGAQDAKATQESASGQKQSSDKRAPTKKRRLSPEGRRRIIEATKRRWAAKRAAEQDSRSKKNAVSNRQKAAA